MVSPKFSRVSRLQRFDVRQVTSSKSHMSSCGDAMLSPPLLRSYAALLRGLVTQPCYAALLRSLGDVDFSETHQREVPERRHQPALGQFHAARARQPLRIARPGELGGAEAERANHRLQALLDEAAQAGIGTDPSQDDEFAARP